MKRADDNCVNFKSVVETAVAAVQNSVSTAIATARAAAGPASTGGGYKAKTLDADERMKNRRYISGDEIIAGHEVVQQSVHQVGEHHSMGKGDH